MTSFAVALMRFTDDGGGGVGVGVGPVVLLLLGSLRNTEENLENLDKYLVFLVWVAVEDGAVWLRRLTSSSSPVTELGLEESQ